MIAKGVEMKKNVNVKLFLVLMLIGYDVKLLVSKKVHR